MNITKQEALEGFVKMTAEHALSFFKMLELENYFAATIEDPQTKTRYAITFCKINNDIRKPERFPADDEQK